MNDTSSMRQWLAANMDALEPVLMGADAIGKVAGDFGRDLDKRGWDADDTAFDDKRRELRAAIEVLASRLPTPQERATHHLQSAIVNFLEFTGDHDINRVVPAYTAGAQALDNFVKQMSEL